MFLSLLKTATVRFVGVVVFIVGVWIGLIAYYGEQPWQKNVLVQYGGVILAWVVAGLGIALMAYKAPSPKALPRTEKT